MGKIVEWDIYWAEVAFEEDPTQKKWRPVVIKANGGAFLMSFYATTQAPKPGYDCYTIQCWKEAGFEKPTVVRLDKCLKLNPADFGDYIGHLEKIDVLLIQLDLARITNR